MTVILDKAWADLLGVRREQGVYRISRRELLARLAGLRQARPPPLPSPPPHAARPDGVVVALPLDTGAPAPISANGRG
ncbi:MAG: hypothetical protein ACRDKW_04230 [Actinomycetota bacterium]